MEVNLIEKTLPKSDRSARLKARRSLSEAQRAELGLFDREYFEGTTGYGGYTYDGRYEPGVRRMVQRYGLTPVSRVLDVGCAKGFALFEFVKAGVSEVHGCDISEYAVRHGHPPLRKRLAVMSADQLAYPDQSFDLVYSVDVLHNLPPQRCDRAIAEMMRVSRGPVFLQVASFTTPAEEQRLRQWGVTVRTVRSRSVWLAIFDRLRYGGDYFFKTF